jgi:hypothetical protein
MKRVLLLSLLLSSLTIFASPEGPAKGYNYKKHHRKMLIHKWIDRKLHHNICDQYPN